MPQFRARAAIALGLAAGLVLAGCSATPGTDADEASTAETVQTGGTYTHAFSAVGAITSLDPPTLIFHEALQVVRALADSLVDQKPDGTIVPWIAESWEINDDATVYTFHLREGGTFSDGAPIDAAAVKANFDRAVALGPKAVGAYPLLLGLTETKVVDPRTVEFDFAKPAAYFLQAVSGAVFGLISPNDLGKDPADLAKGEYAGSGPFTLASYNPQTEIDLDKRVGYDTPSSIAEHTGDAYVDHLRLVEIGDASTRANQVADGEIQSAALIAFQDEARLSATEGVTLLPLKIPGLTETLIINQKSFLGTDAPAREAIQLAIDSKTIVSTVFGPSYGAGASAIGSGTPGFADQSGAIEYDPAKAERVLDDDGWTVGDDGIRTKDGTRFTVRVPAIGNWPGAELLQAQLLKVGIDLPLDKSDQATSSAALANGDYEADKWQMTRADVSVLNAVWNSNHTSQGYAWASPGPLDELLDAQESAIDPGDRAAASAKVQQYLIENHWAIPLDDRAWTYAYNASAHGLRADGETKLVFYDVWVSQG
ncbi:ABC transporter substrate-binding protein [Galbitalea sp. SE-J8]|uniref:ABC transporter substrate-binding protein n=1 Tax=Galbitalea sp. SE-J8 TaxID=3054952 RepID=UPI00259C6F1A|nr:ABC transporter substrate-binding protein [Galbitalea sp. SE-J8]MDM4761584.1 ABC transporter substrate-binding protein [Galbitalea sp. SE-J8]